MWRKSASSLLILIFAGNLYGQEVISPANPIIPSNPANHINLREDSLNFKIDMGYTQNLQKAIELLQMDSLNVGLSNLLKAIRIKYKNFHDDRIEQYNDLELFNFLQLIENKNTLEPDKDLIKELIHEMVNFSIYTQYQLKIKNIVSNEEYSELHYRLLLYCTILRGDYQTAASYVDKILEKNPNLLSVNSLKASMLYSQENWTECKRYSAKTIELFPEYAWGYLVRGICNKALGQIEIAENDILKAIELYPDFAFAINEMGVIYLNESKFDAAFLFFKKAFTLNPSFDWPCFNMGLIYSLAAQADSSLKYFNKAIEINPNVLQYFKRRGDVYFDLKHDYNSAIDDYSKCIVLDPNNALYYYNRGQSNLFLNKVEEAIYDFTKANELSNNYVGAIKGLGDCYYQKREYIKALEYYNKTIELDKKFDLAYIMRGEVFMNLNQVNKALKDFDKGIELNPYNKFFYADRGNVYVYQGNFRAAIADFNKSLDLDRDFVFANQRIGDCYYFMKDYTVAMVYYSKVIELDTTYYYAYNSRAMIYLERKDYELAVRDFKKVISIKPDFDSAIGNLGWVYYLKNDFKNCLDFSKRAVELNPDAFYAKFNVALATLRLGNFEEAKKIYTMYYKEAKEKKQNVSGAINDLLDLISKQIMVDQAKYIIDNILMK